MKIPAFINWKSVSTSIVTLIAVGIVTFGGDSVSAWYQDFVKRDELSKYAKLDDVQTIQQDIRSLTTEIRRYRKDDLTITGRARVQTQTSTECSIRINTAGNASAFLRMKQARITNLSNRETPSTTVEISGTFRSAEADYLAVLSTVAGNRVDARPGDWIDLRIEPIEE